MSSNATTYARTRPYKAYIRHFDNLISMISPPSNLWVLTITFWNIDIFQIRYSSDTPCSLYHHVVLTRVITGHIAVQKSVWYIFEQYMAGWKFETSFACFLKVQRFSWRRSPTYIYMPNRFSSTCLQSIHSTLTNIVVPWRKSHTDPWRRIPCCLLPLLSRMIALYQRYFRVINAK